MAKKAVKKEQDGERRPVFWITGNYYDCKKKWAEILSEYDSPPNVDVHDCSYNSESMPANLRSSQANEVILALKQRDMFDDRPMIIRLLGCPQDYTQIYDYLHYADEMTKLVITGPIGYYSPAGSGVKFNSAKTSNFFKLIKEWGNVFEFPEEVKRVSDAVSWIENVVKDHGIKIERDAASLLVELKGKNLDILYGELSRIMSYEPKCKLIKSDLVSKCCLPLFVKTTWDLMDSLDCRDYDASISHLDQFLEIAGTEVGASFSSDVNDLLAAIRHHYDFILIAKCACPKTLSSDLIWRAVEDMKKPQKKDGKWTYETNRFNSGYIYTNLDKQCTKDMINRDIKILYNILRGIHRCILECRKNSNDKARIRNAMMLLIMTICGKLPCTLE